MPPRSTVQRRLISELLCAEGYHPTALELYHVVRQRLPKISLGTVYRNLDYLARIGQVRRLSGSGREIRFDGDLRRHYHVRCVGCGRIDDLAGEPSVSVDDSVKAPAGWEISGHSLEFVGRCLACREAARRSAAANGTRD